MRTALALAVAVTLAAGCGSGDDPPVPPCRSEAVFVQQVPKLGLSKIEDLPATPEQVRLDPNPALIDGALDGSAGVDLGSGRTLAGDHHLRDIGAEFADPTVVNRVDVHVDRALPPDVAATLTWTAIEATTTRPGPRSSSSAACSSGRSSTGSRSRSPEARAGT